MVMGNYDGAAWKTSSTGELQCALPGRGSTDSLEDIAGTIGLVPSLSSLTLVLQVNPYKNSPSGHHSIPSQISTQHPPPFQSVFSSYLASKTTLGPSSLDSLFPLNIVSSLPLSGGRLPADTRPLSILIRGSTCHFLANHPPARPSPLLLLQAIERP
jgi:hypothetical protein